MRDQWYSDQRDLVKWGTLLELARRFRIEHILQVLYHRPSTWASLVIDGEAVPLPPEVREHFRDTNKIGTMCISPRIELVKTEFLDREAYLGLVRERIARREALLNSIVFLDPDTGLQPKSVARPEHAAETDVQGIWEEMRRGDVFALYQHQTGRDGKPWIEPKRAQLADVLNTDESNVKVAAAPRIARDVVLFFAVRA